MRTNQIIGAVFLVVGIVLGALLGAWFERGRSHQRTVAAVAEESARAEHLQQSVSQLQERTDLSQIHLRLCRVALEADRQDYGTASELAARLFDDAARMAEGANRDGKARAALQRLLAARDEVTAGLATGKPAAAETLKRLCLDF